MAEAPAGIPEVLYHLPELEGMLQCEHGVHKAIKYGFGCTL